MRKQTRSLVVPLTAFGVGAVLLAIDAYRGQPPLATALGFGVVLAYAAIIWVYQTRSETVAAMAGKPVDERWQLVHERSLGLSATLGAVAALVGFAALQLAGGDGRQFLVMAVVIGLSYIAGLIWFGRRL